MWIIIKPFAAVCTCSRYASSAKKENDLLVRRRPASTVIIASSIRLSLSLSVPFNDRILSLFCCILRSEHMQIGQLQLHDAQSARTLTLATEPFNLVSSFAICCIYT